MVARPSMFSHQVTTPRLTHSLTEGDELNGVWIIVGYCKRTQSGHRRDWTAILNHIYRRELWVSKLAKTSQVEEDGEWGVVDMSKPASGTSGGGSGGGGGGVASEGCACGVWVEGGR